MPVICIGPVCIPLNLLLPFLIGVLHSYGYFKWFKKEWVTINYWMKRWRGEKSPVKDTPKQQQVADTDNNDSEVHCDGDVCRLVPKAKASEEKKTR